MKSLRHKVQMEFSLGVVLIKEGHSYIGYVPALDLSSHGESYEDAAQAAGTAAQVFLEELVRMGTLEEVLLNLGWQKKRATKKGMRQHLKSTFSLIPPEVFLGQKSVNITCRA